MYTLLFNDIYIFIVCMFSRGLYSAVHSSVHAALVIWGDTQIQTVIALQSYDYVLLVSLSWGPLSGNVSWSQLSPGLA